MRLLKLWIPVFFWCWLIYYLSSTPNLKTEFGRWDLILRKAAHITEYFILAWLSFRAFKGTFSLSYFYQLFSSGLFSLLYATSDEYHQSFVPTRGPSLEDVLIDAAGIITFFILLEIRKKLIR